MPNSAIPSIKELLKIAKGLRDMGATHFQLDDSLGRLSVSFPEAKPPTPSQALAYYNPKPSYDREFQFQVREEQPKAEQVSQPKRTIYDDPDYQLMADQNEYDPSGRPLS